MIDVVVLVDGGTEDPEVINTGNEVDDTDSIVLCFTDVSQQVLAANLNPVLLNHDPNILQLVTTVGEKDSIVFNCIHTFQHSRKEWRRQRGRHHVEADSSCENSLNAWD